MKNTVDSDGPFPGLSHFWTPSVDGAVLPDFTSANVDALFPDHGAASGGAGIVYDGINSLAGQDALETAEFFGYLVSSMSSILATCGKIPEYISPTSTNRSSSAAAFKAGVSSSTDLVPLNRLPSIKTAASTGISSSSFTFKG